MDIAGVLNIILPIVFSLVGVALIVFLIELVKTIKAARTMVEDLGPTLKNVEDMTAEIKPAIAQIDPLLERVQLTVDSLNLEMMRVDQILEDVSEITDTASSATAAVDNITNVPLKAVNTMASRVRSAFGAKSASDEAEQLAEQRVAVAQALEDYKAAEKKSAKAAKKAEGQEAVEPSKAESAEPAKVEEPATEADAVEEPGVPFNSEPVIDPKVIAESEFFTKDYDAE